jgi:hypothetical protein
VMSSGCLSPITIILGLMAWIMGQSDLRKIKRNEIDPDGESLTQGGWICGIIGTVLSCLFLLGCVGLWGMIYLSETSRVRNTRPKFGAPPPQFRPGPPRPRRRPGQPPF